MPKRSKSLFIRTSKALQVLEEQLLVLLIIYLMQQPANLKTINKALKRNIKFEYASKPMSLRKKNTI